MSTPSVAMPPVGCQLARETPGGAGAMSPFSRPSTTTMTAPPEVDTFFICEPGGSSVHSSQNTEPPATANAMTTAWVPAMLTPAPPDFGVFRIKISVHDERLQSESDLS